MSKRLKASVVVAMSVLATAVTMVADASHTCSGTVRDTGVTPAGQFYVDYRDSGGIWIYQETNLVNGLQRGGKSLAGSVDHCEPSNPPVGYTPDKLIF